MDWVKVYSLVAISNNVVIPMVKSGMWRPPSSWRYAWYDGLGQVLATLPIWGRIFGYW